MIVKDLLPGHRQAKSVQQAEAVEIRAQRSSVRHVEVFQLGGVGTPIIGRPRPLPAHRRAAHYTLNCEEPEILAALGWASLSRSARGNITGVAWSEDTHTDALLINLRKSEADFSPTTMYRDYAISPELFHWESQNATSTASPAGRRYLNHQHLGTHVVLFVREAPDDDIGAAPFRCLGQVSYVEHRGERPIAITWKLQRAMPTETYRMANVVS